MKIAVLMSTYNGEKYIDEQIQSVLNQKGDFKIDLIVRDDGSNDQTLACIKKYSSIILDESNNLNLGPAKSFLYLLKKYPNYDYYAFCDQDDVWNENKIDIAVQYLKDQQTSALYFSNATIVDSNLNIISDKVYKNKPKTDFYTLTCAGGLLGCTMVFNQKLALKINEKELPNELVMHDFYVAVVCLATDGVILYNPNAMIMYRQHGNNAVGVSYGLFSKINHRVKEILTQPRNSIAQQANTVLCLYDEEISYSKKKWLKKVSRYRKSFASRLSLALSNKTKYINKNMGLKNRLAIFLGNR